MYYLVCNALVHVIYSGVSGQCSHTIQATEIVVLTTVVKITAGI